MLPLKLYALAADVVLALHAVIALFAVLGGLLVPLLPALVYLHIPIVLWSGIVNLADWTCPLTPLEQNLRKRSQQASFDTGWIQHYIEPLVRPLGMPRHMELVAGVSVLVWNALVYGMLWMLA